MAKKKKSKIVLRPWCWYCEREFEDEKVLMQHQKAKHFKCHQCPRRLNTAGGLAVHIQQVHKLDPDQLPRIDNAIPGRDGYEVEIFGMEGIPVPDVADYKRRKEQELGLPAGSISGSGKGLQQNKRPKIEKRVLTTEELRIQLEAHKALMGATDGVAKATNGTGETNGSGGAVYNAAPQTYVNPPMPAPGAMPPFMPGMPPPPFPPQAGFPGAMPPIPGAVPGGPPPPFPPFVPGGFPPGAPPPGFPFPPGMPPPPGLRPPIPPSSASPPGPGSAPPMPPLPPSQSPMAPAPAQPPSIPAAAAPAPPPRPRTPNPPQTNPPLKAGTVLIWSDANYSPIEKRALDQKYYVAPQGEDGSLSASVSGAAAANPRGTKRARAEDFL